MLNWKKSAYIILVKRQKANQIAIDMVLHAHYYFSSQFMYWEELSSLPWGEDTICPISIPMWRLCRDMA